MSAFASDNCSSVNICFHAQSRGSEQYSHAEGGTFPACYKNRIILLTSLVYNLPYVGRGVKLCNKVRDTAPAFPGLGIQNWEGVLAASPLSASRISGHRVANPKSNFRGEGI